jgi:hypothetical protein
VPPATRPAPSTCRRRRSPQATRLGSACADRPTRSGCGPDLPLPPAQPDRRRDRRTVAYRTGRIERGVDRRAFRGRCAGTARRAGSARFVVGASAGRGDWQGGGEPPASDPEHGASDTTPHGGALASTGCPVRDVSLLDQSAAGASAHNERNRATADERTDTAAVGDRYGDGTRDHDTCTGRGDARPEPHDLCHVQSPAAVLVGRYAGGLDADRGHRCQGRPRRARARATGFPASRSYVRNGPRFRGGPLDLRILVRDSAK